MASSREQHVLAMPANHKGQAALFDVESGTWRLTAPVPFQESLYNPIAVWAGDAYLVLGNRCGTSSDAGGALPVCEPGGLAAALYAPSNDRWTAVESPAGTSEVLSLAAIGSIGERSFVQLESTAYVYDDGLKRWEQLPDAPAPWDRVCISGGLLVAGGSQSANVAVFGQSGILDTSLTPDEPPLSGSVFDPTTGRWSSIARAGPVDGGGEFQAICSADGLLMIPTGPPLLDDAWSVYSFNEVGWTTLPPPPERLGAIYASVPSNDSTTMWAEGVRATLSRPPGAVWETLPGPENVLAASPVDSDRVLLVRRMKGGQPLTEVVRTGA